MRIRRALLVFLLPLALFVGCGGDDDDDDAAASDDSEEEATDDGGGGEVACPAASAITTAVGVTAADPTESDTPDYLQCTYSIEDADAGVFGVVNVSVYRSGGESGKEIFDDVADDEEAVDGIGDAASWSPLTTSLFVVQGDGGVEILLSGLPEDADAQAVAIAVAEVALG